MNYTQFDPFNHGTATITYATVSKDRKDTLLKVLEKGWGKEVFDIKQLSAGAEKNSNNFKVECLDGNFLLKCSHITTSDKQDLINTSIAYLGEKGEVSVPNILKTLSEPTFYQSEQGIFCLHTFLSGENYNGSCEELVNIGMEIAKLHRGLKDMPYANEIKLKNGEAKVHDPTKLEEIIKAIKTRGEITKFDSYSKNLLEELKDTSQRITISARGNLPAQTIHYDLHPHNVLFDPEKKEVQAILDFDSMRLSQRARDVGFALHRFSRTYGERTERKSDIGVDIRKRAKLFLDAYLSKNDLTDEEVKALPFLIQDEALNRVMIILGNHYLRDNTTWSFDLPKQVTTMREGSLFSF